MNTKEITQYKKTLKLNKKQREIIVGLLLGDGHLETQNNGKTYRLKIEHSIKQLDYVNWLYEVFQDWINGSVYQKTKNGKIYVGFTTHSHSSLRYYGHQFYVNKEKRIPKQIGKMITSLSLAIWFMDDGSRKSEKHYTYNIHSLGFSKPDLNIIAKSLKQRFQIEVKLHKQKDKYWRLYIGSEYAYHFYSLIKDFVLPIKSMQSKLGNTKPKK